MKKTAPAIISLILLLVIFTSTAAAKVNISVDGEITDSAWQSADSLVLADSKSETGNNFRNAAVSFVADSSTNMAYYLISFSIDKAVSDDEALMMGITFTPEGCSSFTINGDEAGTKKTFSGDRYAITAVMQIQKNTGSLYCEAAVNYKDGIPDTAGGSAYATDNTGNDSNRKTFSFKNPDAATVITQQTEKTTAEKTTKRSTTKSADESKTTTETSATRRVHNTTAHKARTTTTRKAVTFASGKTTAASTAAAAKSSSAKSRKSGTTTAKETEADPEVIYTYASETTTAETATDPLITETGTSSASAFGINGMNRSTLYKITAGGCAFLLFAIMGVAAVRSGADSDKKKDENKNTENKNTDNSDKAD